MIYLITTQQRINKESDIQLSTIDLCLKYFKDKSIIEVDTETGTNTRNPKQLPNPYETPVLSLQLGDKNNQFVIDPNTIDIQPLKVLFEDETKTKIFCNSFFDLRFLWHWGFKTKTIYDIFLAEMLLTLGKNLPKGYRGLEQMGQRYLNIEINKNIRGQIHWRGLDDDVVRYAANDVAHMNDIRIEQLKKIKEYELEVALELENRFAIVLSHISYKGFKIDPTKWLKVAADNKLKLKEVLAQLDKYLVDNKLYKYIDITLFDQRSNINWNSSKQVVKLFKDLGINTLVRNKQTGEMEDSVDGIHLSRQKNKFPILPIYLKYKEVQKELSTYGEKFLKDNLNPVTKRIHSEYFQLVDTGRISSNNPNLLNIPATDDKGENHPLRKCFIVEEENLLVVSDYVQEEPRILAEYCQDPYLIDFILNGDGDSHSLVSTMISEYLLGEHIIVSKKNNPIVPRYNQKIRDIGKKLNLKLDYGGTAFSLKEDLDTTQDEAQRLIDIISSKTPKKQEYFTKCFNFIYNRGYIVIDPITKRRTWFNKYHEFKKLEEAISKNRSKRTYSEYSKVKGEMERFARNYRVQGTGGSIIKFAALYFNKELEKRNISDKAWIVNLIYDEMAVECHKDYAKEVSEIVQKVMIDVGKLFCKTIPMKTEPSIGTCWEK
jgi:DNA polymerase-1